jgi:hypothetical protein
MKTWQAPLRARAILALLDAPPDLEGLMSARSSRALFELEFTDA